MDKNTLKRRRGQRVLDLLEENEEIKTLGQLSKNLCSDSRDAKRLEAKLRRRVPDKDGVVSAKEPLPLGLCMDIARVFGVQPSSVYLEVLPEEQGGSSSEQPATQDGGRKQGKRKSSSIEEEGPTVSVPLLGIKDQLVEETRLIRTNNGFVLQLRIPVTFRQLRKFVEREL